MSKACRNDSASQRLLCEIMHLGERAMDTVRFMITCIILVEM